MRNPGGKAAQAFQDQVGSIAAKQITEVVQANEELLEAIVADFTPADPIIRLDLNGKILTFNAALDRKIMNDVKARALAFANEEIHHPDPAIDAAYSMDPQTKAQASILAEMSVQPRLPAIFFLQLARRATLSFDTIFNKWAEAHGSQIVEKDVDMIERAVKRIDRDPIWRMRLKFAKDAYHQHPDQLDGGTYEDVMLIDFIALGIVEGREINQATAG